MKQHSKHKAYNRWQLMKNRCYCITSKDYANYGARGISICDAWLDPKTFLSWVDSTYVEGTTLDRIDNSLGYFPENCRWVDRSIQNINRRKFKTNTSGYIGIAKEHNKWLARIKINNNYIRIGLFNIKEEAILARDNYIIENKLPHKLSTEYIKEK